MQAMREGMETEAVQANCPGEFLKKFSPAALKDLMSLVTVSTYPANFILFSEKEAPRGVYVVLEGEVKLSINSSEGRRLRLRIARKGEILGLSAALSGGTYEMTAETVFPAQLVPIGRREFRGFLMRHPE